MKTLPSLTGIAALLVIPATGIAQARPAGVDVHGAWTSEIFRNVGSGTPGTAHLHNLDLTAELDGSSLGWSGGRVFVYALGNTGQSLASLMGDLQGATNIEAPRALRLYEAWVEQTIAGGRASVLGGLYDLNGEFYVMERGDLFLNSSHGIGVELAQSGQAGPSIFPVTSLALRLAADAGERVTLRAVVLDAVPGDPERPAATAVHLGRDEGALVVAEAELHGADRWRVAAGAWRYTMADRPEWAEEDPPVRNGGTYLIAEGDVIRHEGGLSLGAYGRIGTANALASRVDLGWGGGLVLGGFWPRRPDDRFGFAVATARNGDPYRTRAADPFLASDETAFEATYEAPLLGWLSVRFDVQAVRHPDTRLDAETAVAFGQRLTLSF